MTRPRLRRLVRQHNPRGLTRQQYKAELAASEEAWRAVRAASSAPVLSPEQRHRLLQERYAPRFTKDELCAIAERELIAEAARRR